MKFQASSGEGFKSPDAGLYVGVCTKIIDIGTHDGLYGPKHQVVIFWELSEEMDDGRPFQVNKWYNFTLGSPDKPSNLRKDLVAWRGKQFTPEEENGFEAKNILGKCCTINMVLHKDGSKTGVGTVTGLMKGQAAIKPVDKPVIFSIDEWDQAVFDGLTDFWKKQIMTSEEYAHRNHGEPVDTPDEDGDSDDSQIPF